MARLTRNSIVLGVTLLAIVVVATFTRRSRPKDLPGPCELSRRYTWDVRQSFEGLGGWSDPLPPHQRVRYSMTLTPKAHSNGSTLYEVIPELAGVEGVPDASKAAASRGFKQKLWVTLDGQGRIEKLFTDAKTQGHALNLLRPYVFLLQHPAHLDSARRQTEQDEMGTMEVTYQNGWGKFSKARQHYREPSPVEISESEWHYEPDHLGMKILGHEIRRLPFLNGKKITQTLDVEAQLDQFPVSSECAVTTIDGYVAQYPLKKLVHGLESDREADRERIRKVTAGQSVSSIWNQVRRAKTDKDRYSSLHSLTVYLEAHPEAVNEVLEMILKKKKVDTDFIDLVGALASADCEAQPAAMRQLIRDFENDEPKLEKVLRTYQLSLNIHESNLDVLWDISQTHSKQESGRVALYAVGTALNQIREGASREQYLDHLIAPLSSHSPNSDYIAAVGNAGAVEAEPVLLKLSRDERSEVARNAIDALRFIPTTTSQARLVELAQQSRDLELHDHAVFALNFQPKTPELVNALQIAHNNLPAHEEGRKKAIAQLLE